MLFRNLRKSQSIRMRLGGSPDPFAPFPAKPGRMHHRTYRRLRAQAKAAEASLAPSPNTTVLGTLPSVLDTLSGLHDDLRLP